MAAQFCVKCGKPLPAEAQFCSGCGTPVAAAAPTPAAAGAPPASPPPAAAPAAAPAPAPAAALPLGTILGLQDVRKFLLQHQLFSGGRNYRVLSHEKKHLFTVREDVRQELVSNILTRPAQQMGFHMGIAAPTPQTFVWTVLDAAGVPQGRISIQVAGNSTVSTLMDGNGTPVLAVSVQRSMIGGLSATAAFPDGREMYRSHGNLLRHNFSILDPGGAEVAKIHEAWASVRDTYNLDLLGNVDPLCPLIFAILIDREKAAQ